MYGVGYLQDTVMFILQYYIYIYVYIYIIIISTPKAKTVLSLNFKKKNHILQHNI